MASITSPAAPAVPRSAGWLNTIALMQGVFYLGTGIWPLVHIDSFQVVTGDKRDLWLVYTVGALVSVVGAVLLLAGAAGRVTPEIWLLAVGSAVALASIDVIFVTRGVIDRIYLADAAAEGVLVLGWLAAAASGRRAG